MSDPRPSHVPWLTPYLTVRDARASASFYEQAFGFTVHDMVDDDGAVMHVEMFYQGQLILMFAPEGAFASTARTPRTSGVEAPQSFYVYTEDVDALYARATTAGAKGLMPPSDQFWGDRFCQLEDPDGYRWGFARPVAPRS
ncbi:VOC family protein [Pandoraea anhela]|uniref:Glyoxalase n=1 Tax=Pandoraea anhela TaxID=2508295 RepID=A0A5E4Y6D7_9BURK|nr:glyoxalase/bleomycin resistance/extradiol dioxygenase family protein [Pandoraea anhela]VVE44216.1 glyoxalase [Pandoraea anhela]